LGDITIKVLPADPGASGAQVFQPLNQVRETENDIRYIKKGDFVLSKQDPEFFNSATHVGFLFGSVALLAGGLLVRRKHIRDNSNIAIVKQRKAAKLARRQLRVAERLMMENRKDAFYTEILNALNNYLSHKLDIAAADLSRENIGIVLRNKKVEESLSNMLFQTLDIGEYAKYAPGAVSGDLPAVYKNTATLITELEQQLNRKI
jgi:hypothetical protein